MDSVKKLLGFFLKEGIDRFCRRYRFLSKMIN